MPVRVALIFVLSLINGWGQLNHDLVKPTADTILLNGTMLTMDAADSISQAIAIGHGRIIAVGSNQAVLKFCGAATKIIDLQGRTATPGLIDSHLHFASVDSVYSINLSTIHNVAEALNALRQRVSTAKPGDWIQGQGWDEGKLAEHRYLLASDLDQVAPNNPVWLIHTTGHYGVANTAALKLAHVTAETPNPTAGTIDRNADGTPTGVLKEQAAMQMVTRLIPDYSPTQMRDGYLTMMANLNREGITAIKDPGMMAQNWTIYDQLRNQDKLTIHLFALWRGGTTLAETKAAVAHILSLPLPTDKAALQKDDRLISGGVKLFMDGSGGARTAWMTSDWNKNFSGIDTGNRGYPLIDPQVYRQQVHLIHNSGVHVGTHAIGDRAIDWVVDTYARVLAETPTKGLRHSIIHANIPSDHAIASMATLEQQYDAGYPEAQAEFMYWIGDTYAGNFGAQRCLRLMPFQTYLQRGIKWGGGSDFPVTPFAPRLGLWSSMVRETLNGTYGRQPFGTAEAVDIHAAMRAYTTWAAHQLFLEDHIGSLETGKDADIAVWDRDPYTISSSQVKDMKCLMTLFQGRIVYDSGVIQAVKQATLAQPGKPD